MLYFLQSTRCIQVIIYLYYTCR